MNITSIGCNYSSTKNNSIHKQNANISFCGVKTKIAEKTKENAGCVLNMLLAAVSIPLALLSMLFTNKNDEIERMTVGIQNEYENHLGHIKYFQELTDEMDKFLDKHSKNDEYAQFVKEAISFLRTNFEQNQLESGRMEPFDCNKEVESKMKWLRFMDTIQKSAKAAVTKNYKDIDIEKLNENIRLSREIMQNQI